MKTFAILSVEKEGGRVNNKNTKPEDLKYNLIPKDVCHWKWRVFLHLYQKLVCNPRHRKANKPKILHHV